MRGICFLQHSGVLGVVFGATTSTVAGNDFIATTCFELAFQGASFLLYVLEFAFVYAIVLIRMSLLVSLNFGGVDTVMQAVLDINSRSSPNLRNPA